MQASTLWEYQIAQSETKGRLTSLDRNDSLYNGLYKVKVPKVTFFDNESNQQNLLRRMHGLRVCFPTTNGSMANVTHTSWLVESHALRCGIR